MADHPANNDPSWRALAQEIKDTETLLHFAGRQPAAIAEHPIDKTIGAWIPQTRGGSANLVDTMQSVLRSRIGSGVLSLHGHADPEVMAILSTPYRALEVVAYVLEVCPANQDLRAIELSNNHLGGPGMARLAKALAASAGAHPHHLSCGAHRFERLERLCITKNAVTDIGLAVFAEALAQSGACGGLQCLSLGGNELGDAGMASRRRDCHFTSPAPLRLVGLSIWMKRGCHQNDSLADG